MALAFTRQRLWYPPAVEGVANTVKVKGRFTTAGAGAPTVFSTGPFTVTRSGVGRLVVTFTDLFVELLHASAELADATGSSKRALVDSSTLTAGASPNTPASFTIETQSTAGTAADLTGPIVMFSATFRKGRLTK